MLSPEAGESVLGGAGEFVRGTPVLPTGHVIVTPGPGSVRSPESSAASAVNFWDGVPASLSSLPSLLGCPSPFLLALHSAPAVLVLARLDFSLGVSPFVPLWVIKPLVWLC